jgi:cleavage and polyadenylation specificity factor subunit 3
MLQSGASRELFEAWAGDKKNGVILTGYSVPGTLANDLKTEPDTVTLTDGRKVRVQATVKFITFSAHSDYDQTAEFIKCLKANVVVLVHGEEYEMGRMQKRLKEEYPDLNVHTPQNCVTIALTVPPDRQADAVGHLAEELSNTQRARSDIDKIIGTDASGLLVEDASGNRLLLGVEDLASYTTMSACKLEQCQRFSFPHSLAMLGRALRETYDDVVVVDGCLAVCDCVRVSLSNQVLAVVWQASPMNDLVADSVALAAIELTRSPSIVQAMQGPEEADACEARLFRVVSAYLQQEYGSIACDGASQTIKFEVDGHGATVDFASRSVECADEATRERVRTALRRCEMSLRPVPVF